MSAAIIPCEKNKALEAKIEAFAEAIRIEAHKLSGHGLSEKDFYESGILEGAIQRIQGNIPPKWRPSATSSPSF